LRDPETGEQSMDDQLYDEYARRFRGFTLVELITYVRVNRDLPQEAYAAAKSVLGDDYPPDAPVPNSPTAERTRMHIPQPTPADPEQFLRTRYANGYTLARLIILFGGFLRVVAIVVGIVSLLAVLFTSRGVPLVMLYGMLTAISGAFTLYFFGLLGGAAGHMLFAVFDNAVQVSPLTDEQKWSLLRAEPR
jgi:hypothetical protein